MAPRQRNLSPALTQAIEKTGAHVLEHGIWGSIAQFSDPLTKKGYAALDRLLARHTSITLRAYGSYDGLKDVSYLRALPNARRVMIDHFPIGDWSGMEGLSSQLEFLYVHTYGTKIPLSEISKRSRLRSLELTSSCAARDYPLLGQMKALQKLSLEKARLNAETCEALKSLGQLKELSLSQCNVADWSFLGHLSRLRSLTANSSLLVSSELNLPAGLRTLELIGGNMADLSWLEALPKLETLVLSTSSRTESLRPLTKLRSLRKLYLGGFPKVSALPDLSGLTKLESVSLGRLSALNGLAPLRKVKTLRKLAVSGMKQLDVQDFQPLVGHPRLKELQLGLGSVRTHRAIYALLGL